MSRIFHDRPRLLVFSLCFLAAWLFVGRPKAALAHCPGCGIFAFAGADAGWEGMLTKGDNYKKLDNGFKVSLSAGISAAYLFGLQIEQELGFIHYRPKAESLSLNALFKGGTFFMWPLVAPLPHLLIMPRVGIGVIYMGTPEGIEKKVQNFFGFKAALSLIITADDDPPESGELNLGGGLDLDYTMGAAKDNVFSAQNIYHFFAIKAKFLVTF